ncbi:NTP transferase domain-containing protein, partial [candidate division KSB1 bacterium]|nr:NTP transferase domain-containing protein [candidate division KSB1 bacterium]NIS28083.1 NTP transferase domain-containing protein [candidate division KSB1 bacterium]NIT74970.1 NTP transferase domain-containing protein [candidate division KSB1 bacterium]NIU28754.1 NTP transferase domain-containing protein [candidate division KSB1 bacterium]NIU93452.1 NTP transferase domain-containing protein [candidate division KSB1 bacterium]
MIKIISPSKNNQNANQITTKGRATLEAIILAGGLGKRLRAAVNKSPKPMALVNEQPFLSYVLSLLRRNNIPKVILATGYMHEKIEAFYGESYKGLQIEYSVEEKPLGTG